MWRSRRRGRSGPPPGSNLDGERGSSKRASGIRGFRLLRLGGSAFHGFVRDQYTTLPDIANRPLHMWLDLEWIYTEPSAAFSKGAISTAVRSMIHEVFESFESGSIQELIYKIGTRMLAEIPAVAEVHLEANNRTWDTVVERGEEIGVYTDARPPYGVPRAEAAKIAWRDCRPTFWMLLMASPPRAFSSICICCKTANGVV